ncbi:ArsR/SmtB family transcription factor [Flavisolibacter ginsengisoli]|jgi:DNA-binding transcriptional ArsR family regulator|uniref:DNA-binding transcriptional regulator, ArsR family n=1 Tax=Flavisolibacter ginsengisoli DSM 18119 TaxID=1121884 RepID=A0A1M4X5K1_9BACT|nr:metalloregulator ArsR/SmtB family transcription factor [Flavisolibacter ginsengisoli]SHE88472.1 DNA-binding transcriptional regulator, ArsR family [Flavisolibacter ginsengisoli DSM 18119]
MKTALHIEEDNLKKAALRFRAINNKLRVIILQLIHKNGSMIVQDIYKKLKIEQSVTSQHLSVLRNANLVIAKREGKFIYYAVNYQQLAFLHTTAQKFLEIRNTSPEKLSKS